MAQFPVTQWAIVTVINGTCDFSSTHIHSWTCCIFFGMFWHMACEVFMLGLIDLCKGVTCCGVLCYISFSSVANFRRLSLILSPSDQAGGGVCLSAVAGYLLDSLYSHTCGLAVLNSHCSDAHAPPGGTPHCWEQKSCFVFYYGKRFTFLYKTQHIFSYTLI